MGLIKSLLILKLVVIAFGILAYSKIIYWGDKNVLAKEESKTSTEDVSGANEPTNPTEPKSFLDDLINLPSLNPDKSKKEEIGRYLALAERKGQEIEQRLDTLKAQVQQLKKLEKDVDVKIKMLEEERIFFAQTVQKENEVKEERLNKLVELYAKMEPKKAGPMFAAMDRDLAVAMLKELNPKQVTRILEFMEPEKSVELTEFFGRIRSGQEYELLKQMNQSLLDAFDPCKDRSN
jgi:flagellar motility protein MotE (MotC chaperone)